MSYYDVVQRQLKLSANGKRLTDTSKNVEVLVAAQSFNAIKRDSEARTVRPGRSISWKLHGDRRRCNLQESLKLKCKL